MDSAGAVAACVAVEALGAWFWDPDVSAAVADGGVMVVTGAGGVLVCCSDWAVSGWSL
ncbi:MAG TPA: hypothetical protein VN821_15180 [Candidatus Udaeobacter sp.]|nr:hypothetical protein [Candidatus Udaeobacter sp.]